MTVAPKPRPENSGKVPASVGVGRPCRRAGLSPTTHLFEEPGTLEQAADLACDWFLAHLARPQPAHSIRPTTAKSGPGPMPAGQ